MKKLWLPLLFCCTVAQAQTTQDLVNDGKNTDNITTYGMGYDHKRYSPLRQINTSNVKRLVPVWNTTLSNLLGEQAQPLVYEGVMYVTNAAWTFAIDVATGKQLWRTAVDYDPGTPRVVCCGVSNKGAAILNGKLYRTTLDAFVVALDMKTGKQVWKEKFAEWKEGYSSLAAPIIAKDALVAALKAGRPGRGAIDVFEEEPVLNANHPLIGMDNVVCTPHLGYVEESTYDSYYGTAVEQILAYIAGAPINVANPDVLKK